MLFSLAILSILCVSIVGNQAFQNFYSFESARLLSAIDNEAKARSLESSPSESKIHAKRVRNPSSLFRQTDSNNGNASTKRIAHYYPKATPDSQTSPSYAKGDALHTPAESYHHDDYHKHSTHDAHHHHHQHHHSDQYSHKGNSHLEYGLLALSALAFGSFLLNSLLNLLALGAGFFFTSTGTATGTGGGTSTGGGSTSTGGGIITTTSTSTSTGGTSTGGGTVGLSFLDGGGLSSSSLEALNSAAPTFALSRDIRKGNGIGKRRKRPRRSTIHIDVDPYTSFEAMSEFVLNSIEAIKHRHECLPYVLCTGNKRAQVIKKGFQYFIPFYSLCAVYMSKDVGLGDLIPEHIRAILRGLSEANCRSELQQC